MFTTALVRSPPQACGTGPGGDANGRGTMEALVNQIRNLAADAEGKGHGPLARALYALADLHPPHAPASAPLAALVAEAAGPGAGGPWGGRWPLRSPGS